MVSPVAAALQQPEAIRGQSETGLATAGRATGFVALRPLLFRDHVRFGIRFQFIETMRK